MKNIAIYLYLGFGIVALILIYSIVNSFTANAAAKRAEKAAEEAKTEEAKTLPVTQSALSPTFYKQQKQPYLLISSAWLNRNLPILGEIFKFISLTTVSQNDFSEFIGILQQLSSKTQVSYLAEAYQIKYGKSLASDIVKRFNDSERQQINNLINKLPIKGM